MGRSISLVQTDIHVVFAANLVAEDGGLVCALGVPTHLEKAVESSSCP
jgi:hypothetical protein